jgi:Cu(I)/Ag(I) efflux system membrane fusion protein
MKKTNKYLFILWALGSLWIAGCNQTKTKNSTEESQATTTQSKPAISVSENFQNQLNELTQAYLATKDALVASNAEQASTKAGELLSRLQTIDTTTLSPEALEKWSAHKKSLERSTQTLKAAQKLEEKRVQFEGLSETMYAMVTDFGTSSTLYKQYCPMALNDKGAFWLSAQSDIKNPYFGDAMLTCGEVQETLTFAQ